MQSSVLYCEKANNYLNIQGKNWIFIFIALFKNNENRRKKKISFVSWVNFTSHVEVVSSLCTNTTELSSIGIIHSRLMLGSDDEGTGKLCC